MANNIPQAIWDFKSEETKNRAVELYNKIFQSSGNMGLAIGTTLQTLQKEGRDMTRGLDAESVPVLNTTPQIKKIEAKPFSLPKQEFLQPHLFNPEDYR